MDIKEKQYVDVVVNKKCDICGKISKYKDDFVGISYTISGDQGFCDSNEHLDVCSGTCFIAACKKIDYCWGKIIKTENIRAKIFSDMF